MTYRYYSKMRPVAPGTFPRRGAVEIVNFDDKANVPEAGCTAWGYIVYNRKLDENEIENYELVEVKNEQIQL